MGTNREERERVGEELSTRSAPRTRRATEEMEARDFADDIDRTKRGQLGRGLMTRAGNQRSVAAGGRAS